jgi:outer membrane protein OmpA-like peptidoglycan-associated protein
VETLRAFKVLSWYTGFLFLIAMFILSGCATNKYVGTQVNTLLDRISKAETRIGQTEGQVSKLTDRVSADEDKVSNVEGKVNSVEGEVAKVNSKAEWAMENLRNLKFERPQLLDIKVSTNFDLNSATLSEEAKHKIDEFLNSLKGNLAGGKSTIFLVAGHTDNIGSVDYNYELGIRRADIVKRYLIEQKKIDPLRVVVVSYGENNPIADNNTSDGRAQNRRIEILVYSEAINLK